ncbi:CaiB/BaiF CoA transferase family protein [Lichenicoccus sp.]|uniref:CaiB/BaiF CoA transferase family protein n=1 Tax=Lichenicoccus sp. TaxID=2781899 RepID=UPI003D0CF7E3
MTYNPPLEGIVVVSIEQAVAMPFCTSRLADAGARVIKVERPEGDFARGYDDVAAGQSSYFVWLNRGKESVILDLRRGEDRDRLTTLLASADVFVHNLKPGSIDKTGFSFSKVRERRPEMICCSISGYGDTGPMARRKAYDLLIQAESGLVSLTGSSDNPSRVGISITDIASGATAHAAILEALFARSRGLGGAEIQVSMFDVMADWLSVPLLHAESGSHPQRVGLAHPSIAPYGLFTTADGHDVLISIQNDREWVVLCKEILGRPDIAHDDMLATNVARVANRSRTDAFVREAFRALSFTDLARLLERFEIAFAQVNDMNGLSRHPHLRRITVETPGGPVSYPSPAAIVNKVSRAYGPVPALGENRLSGQKDEADENIGAITSAD